MYPVELVSKESSLVGRDNEMDTAETHTVLNTPLKPPFDSNLSCVILGLGCFWGAERLFWKMDGIYTTAVGYAGGYTPNPTYKEVCSGMTGHTEVVLIVYDQNRVSLQTLLNTFWQEHDPTQGMRQGNDRGSQYRSAIYVMNQKDLTIATDSKSGYQECLSAAGFGAITTELKQDVQFYYAEAYHQQYLDKNPAGYCGLKGTGIKCENE